MASLPWSPVTAFSDVSQFSVLYPQASSGTNKAEALATIKK